MIKDIPKILGFYPDAIDTRDHLYEEFIAGVPSAAEMPTFDKGYDTEDVYGYLDNDDQYNTLGCVPFGGTNDLEMTFRMAGIILKLSQRDAYSQIHFDSGGASPRDFYKLANQKGICEDRFLPTYDAVGGLTEARLRDRSDITPEAIENALQNKIDEYLSISSLDMLILARAIFENGGCGGGYCGINASIGHFIFPKGYGKHNRGGYTYDGIKYKDSSPMWVNGQKTFDKWIIKYNNKFYLDSPSGSEIILYSFWTCLKDFSKTMEYNLRRKPTDTEEVFAITKDGLAKRHIVNRESLIEGGKQPDRKWIFYPASQTVQETEIDVATQSEFDNAQEVAEILLLPKDSTTTIVSGESKSSILGIVLNWFKKILHIK